jgi:hypothetical protein
MEDLSLHILDIAENSVAAQADMVEIIITEAKRENILSLEVQDNGAGMDEETLKKALDPFYTSKAVRRFGFGLSLLSEAAKAANGHLSIESEKGKGTKVRAEFQYDHIDRQPLGDMGQTFITLVIGNPEVDFVYTHKQNDHTSILDTRDIRAQIPETPLNSPAGIRIIRGCLQKLRTLSAKTGCA